MQQYESQTTISSADQAHLPARQAPTELHAEAAEPSADDLTVQEAIAAHQASIEALLKTIE